ncbi:hypothetical protein Tco_1335515 [Tanacetum coccineum]
MDVKITFLNGDLDEEVYIKQLEVSTPMDPVEKLRPNTGKPVDQLEYSRAIGCLMYAMTSTRPDIVYAVGRLSSINNLVPRKLVDFLKLPMEICPIKGYQVCRVSVTIGKSYKVEVPCIVDDIDECNILLRRPWQCEVNGKYDVKRNLYIFSWEGRIIAMVPPKVTLQVPKPKVKVEEKIVKAEIKKVPTLKVIKICKVPLAIGKHYNELVTCDVVDMKACHVQDLLMTYETEYDSDDDSDYQSDKSVDYLSPEISEPTNENNMLADNVRGETFEEHDIYMNQLLKSLNTANKDGITEDPFISVEKHVERYPMYDETTHWRLRKPKYVSVSLFKECLTYYALANGFSLWYERRGDVRVVAKCRQRPARLSDPEKGKQRKQIKYPSASSDDLPTCPWRCYARWMTDEKTFQCISLEDEHTCVRNFNFGSLVNYKWIAKVFGEKIRVNPDIRLYDIADLVMKKYKCKVSLN